MTYQLLTIVLVITLLIECSSNDEIRRITNNDSVRGGKETESINHDNFQVLYINLDKSHDRREFMENQLRFYGYDDYHRVAAVTEEDVVIPEEMMEVNNCVSATASRISSLTKTEHVRTPKALNGLIIETQESRNLSASVYNMRKSHNILITALCGRPRNSLRELVVTLSHLQAIRTAIYSGSSSPYALILEDDTSIAFKIDFKKMVETAPVGFGILQLVTSNDKSVRSLAKAYIKNSSRLWEPRENSDSWCAGAYIINKAVMKPYIDSMIKKLTNGWIGVSVTAGYGPNCTPKSCCANNKKLDPSSLPLLPCINAPRGFQSDHFIFRLAFEKTYISRFQVFTSATSGNYSTVHQHHVVYHQAAFSRINSGLREMAHGIIPLPSFVDTRYQFNKVD